jgi:hypothetical protein
MEIRGQVASLRMANCRFWYLCRGRHKQQGPVLSARGSFPNRIDPVAISNNLIGRDQRTTEVARRCDDRSVRQVPGLQPAIPMSRWTRFDSSSYLLLFACSKPLMACFICR